MRIWSLTRFKKIIRSAIRILFDTITVLGSFAGIFNYECLEDERLNSPTRNMSSKYNISHQRTRNMSGSQSIDIYHKIFTIDRFKIIAVLIVTISACYHVFLHLKNGHNTCKWLLTDGRYQGYNEWQPHGCMMHKYSQSDSKNCMNYISYWGGKNHFAFVGDSRILQLYLEFVGLLSRKPTKSIKSSGKLTYNDNRANVLVEFFWAPYVNDSMREILNSWTNSQSNPRIIVIGSAMWTIKLNNGSEDAILTFKSNVTNMSSTFSKYKDCDVVWMLQDHVLESRLFPNNSMITNRQIDLYNMATIESLISSKAQIWSSAVLIGQGFLGKDFSMNKRIGVSDIKNAPIMTTTSSIRKQAWTSPRSASNGEEFDEEQLGDGLHLPQEALGWDVQVLLNMICNNYMNFDDGSCCTTPENPTPLQMAIAILFATSLVIALTMTLCKYLAHLSQKISLIRRSNRAVLNGFAHYLPSRNLGNKNIDSKDMIGRENVIFNPIAPQAGRSSDRHNSSEETVITLDTQQNLDGHQHYETEMSTSQEMPNSNQNINRNGNKLEINCSHQVTNRKYQDSTYLEDALTTETSSARDISRQTLSSNHDHVAHSLCEENQILNFYSFVCCISKLGIILTYFFVCDRTTFFMKENKYYTHVNFFLPFTYLMILGLFFTEKTPQMQVLNRNQTDEWKGWMQIVILIYHLTGAGKVLSIYMQIRVMVSTYLFLSAYGHFTYFFNKNDLSLHRLCVVIFRFNFLASILCLAMNRPYQFYYFIPLVTFWFVVIFFVMASPLRMSSSNNDGQILSYWWLLAKLILLIVVVTLLYSSEVFFDKVFLSYFFKPLFVSSDESIHDWRFRWSIDRYSSIYGLVFSIILHFIKKIQDIDDSKGGNLSSSRLVTLASIVVSFCGLVCYAAFTSQCQSKEQCNETHSYVAFIPILSYVVLRNMLGCIRKKFSAFFAWFGKISLELFIAQYHIWLAADTHGILVLIPSYPVLNLIMTSFVFVCVAHELKKITTFLTPLLIPTSKCSLLRNILLLLIFIGIRHFLPF